MNLEKIKMREKCCNMLREHHLKWGLTALLDEESLKNGCQRITEEKFFQEMMGASIQTQKEILANPKLSDYVCNLLTNGISINQLEPLIDQVPAEELVTYPVRLVMRTVKAPVPERLGGIFLKYYADEELDEKQSVNLVVALDNYRGKLKTVDEKLIASHKMLFCSSVLSSRFLCALTEYERCVNLMAENEEIFQVLEYISQICGAWKKLDDEDLGQLEKEPKRILQLLMWIESFYHNESEMRDFCNLWLENHALLYDLERMKKKIETGGMEEEAHQMLSGRSSYVAFFYNEHFTETLGQKKEELIIYAITHRKKAFMNLIRENMDLFRDIPSSSFLFDRIFYTKVVNINTMNLKNLKICQNGKEYSMEVLKILSDKGYTFEETVTLINQPKEYAMLYTALMIPQVDKRLQVLRQLVKKQCLNHTMDVNRIAVKLSVKPLCQWMQEDFSHIRELNADISMMLLQEYDRISHLIKDTMSISEARYVAFHAEVLHNKKSMEEVRKAVLDSNPEWLSLKQTFHFSDDFIKENKEHIKRFIYDDGAYIMWKYRQNNTDRDEDLRRLISAELMGRFRELKYHGDDLNREIDYPITDQVKALWIRNNHMEEGKLHVWEEDGLIPVMKIGEVPVYTCLSYQSGTYNRCLLACHDSNKKVLYLSCNGEIVLRAAIRLTKSSFTKVPSNGKSGFRELKFADLEHPEENTGSRVKQQEYLTLFLERAYMSKLPQNMQAQAVRMLFSLLRKKAGQMDALFVASSDYQAYNPEDMVCASCFVYISKSKAGEQYLDSLGGNNCIGNEGSYRRSNFLIEKDFMKLAV